MNLMSFLKYLNSLLINPKTTFMTTKTTSMTTKTTSMTKTKSIPHPRQIGPD